MTDPELRALLVQELVRHLAIFRGEAPQSDPQAAYRSAHALKGAAGLAGEGELSARLARFERRLREGDHAALPEVSALVERAIDRLRAGEAGAPAAWPEPPEEIAPREIDPRVRVEYMTELAERLAAIDAALAMDDPVEASALLFRHIHTIKGAAGAVGDEPLLWFCHGLEESLKGAHGTADAARVAVAEVTRWRTVLGGLAEDAPATLAALRGHTHRPPARGTARPSGRPPEADDVLDPTVRVPAASLDDLFERVNALGVVRERLGARAESSRVEAGRLRRLRADLADALRLIGPPRPWGAPALALRKIERVAVTVSQLADELEVASSDMRGADLATRDATDGARRSLSAMRQTSARGLFQRVRSAVEAEARRAGKKVMVRTVGAEEPIDRRVAEALAEPLMQIARNALAHGIEAPEKRVSVGKAETATLTLSLRRNGNRYSIQVADDGAGVDVAAVRAQAVRAGVVPESIAAAADDETLLALLFLPGFSTRASADLLAGRGVGLDVALAAVQKLGGTIRLASQPGAGVVASLDLPVEAGLETVLWVGAGGSEFAVVVTAACSVRRADPVDDAALPHLGSCLEGRPNAESRYAVVVDVGRDGAPDPLAVGVDEVRAMERVLVRPLTPILATLGPYSGVVLRGDGSLRLAVDAFRLAPHVRALGPPSRRNVE